MTATTDEQLAYNVRSAARALDLSPETVTRYINSGALQAKQLPGGKILIRRDAIDRFLDSLADR